MVVDKLQDSLAYPPRAMRAERAAAYLDISRAAFLRLVDDRILPHGVKISGGIVVWDRLELDSAFDDLKARGQSKSSAQNTMHKILGIKHDGEEISG